MNLIAVLILSLTLSTAHAGFLKKVLIVGGAVYAGNAVAKKVKENKQNKQKEQEKSNSGNKEQNR